MQLLRRLSSTLLLVLLMTLTGCGDGDGDLTGGGNDGNTPSGSDSTLTISLSNSNISGAEPIVVSVSLSGGDSVANRLVSFSSTLGAFSPVSATALTNENGLAEITLTAGSVRGAGEVTLIGSSPTQPLARYVLVAIPLDVVMGELNVAVACVTQLEEKLTSTGSVNKLP